MKTRIHAAAGAIGFLTILIFWSSTLISELFGSYETIASVKAAILNGMFVLIPAMAIAGASGFNLAAGRLDNLIQSKKRRMPIIAGNGLLILLPMAFILESRAAAGNLDTTFYVLQSVELIAGAVNLALMGMNMRDGLRLTSTNKKTNFVKLKKRETIADGTIALHFSKPGGFHYKAGQWTRLSLPALPSLGVQSRMLSIASAPHEDELMIATRLSDSAFKKQLENLAPEAEVKITDPAGEFALNAGKSNPIVFIAGGIGITPFLSMIREASESKSSQRITLFYSNRNPESAAFLSELQAYSKSSPNFDLIATMTDAKDSKTDWQGETGLIDQTMLERYLPQLDNFTYYCVGPTAMVTATQNMLRTSGVSASKIIIESFTGY